MNTVFPERISRICLQAGLWAVLLSGGCSPNSGKDAMQKQVPSLSAAAVRVSDAVVGKSYSAILEGRVNVEIRPQVDGTIQAIYVDEGAKVSAGQTLFKIDDRLYREQYKSALALQHAAEAKLSAAKLDVDKLVPLVENKVISEIQLKSAKAAYRADLAAVEQAKAAAGAAKVNLDYTLIKAPVGGYIGKIPLRIGSLVTKNQTAWLTLLSDVSEVCALFSMSENDFMNFRRQYPGSTIQEKLQKVAPVTLVMSDGNRYPEKGTISTISGQFDQSTGSVRLRAVFPNPGGLLRSGNTGKVIVESLYPGALLVPQAATVEIQDKVFVFLLGKGNKVLKQVISIAGASGNDYIVTSGISAGDIIVTSGMEKLQDGAVIKPLVKAGEPSGSGK
ncbi:MAG: efflux RND transporter periplasmic adaptor subunit [Chlorobiaceae bacterium]|nr:efflux RND transporter periplasmic adaptor subunit [Chlorobiaceae bacterium]